MSQVNESGHTLGLPSRPPWWSCMCVTWLTHTHDVTVTHLSIIQVGTHSHSLGVNLPPKSPRSAIAGRGVNLYIWDHPFNIIWRDSVMSHIWMSHVTHMSESCHTWMSHVTHMNHSCHTYEWVMSHIRMSHVTHMSESCHTCEWVISHMWMSHVMHMNESCQTCEWVMSHMWMSHVKHVNESCHTYKWVTPYGYGMSHLCMSHATHINMSCHTYKRVMSHI